jgi:hypothetical protein
LGARHRSPGFATRTRLPALVRHSACSRTVWLDLFDGSAGSSPAGAKGRAPLVDFCNRIDLRARPTNRSNPAHHAGGRPPAQLFPRVATLSPANDRPLQGARRWSAASREVTGQRPKARVRVAPALPRAPPIAIARGGNFAPTRSLRTSLVASSWRCRLECPTSPGLRCRRPWLRTCPTSVANAALASQDCITRCSAKSGAIRCARDAFHRRMNAPFGG